MSDLTPEHLQQVLQAIEGRVPEETYHALKRWLEQLLKLTRLLEQKRTSLRRLRQLLFGAKTEKTASLIPPAQPPVVGEKKSPPKPTRQPGHGRRSLHDFPGATVCAIAHTAYEAGQRCPACLKGKLYPLPPTTQRCFEGQPPISLTVYALEKLRCNLCGEIYTAPLPPECRSPKYAPTAIAMIALLKYGQGMPWYRLGQLQSALGCPLAPSTQWQILKANASAPQAVHHQLITQAAHASLLHNDDTTMRILKLPRDPDDPRSGTFTTGILAIEAPWQIALFFTGPEHAGENLDKVLIHRPRGLDPPLQMCDALGRNVSSTFVTILGNCLTHGRRKFVDVVAQFPEPCQYVLSLFATVYRHDDHCKAEHLSDHERLRYHQTHSQPAMDTLYQWMNEQLDQRLVEPNSGLGQAITYMRKHWEKLTLFLREPGAPLDNNVCERILKRAILHRKNALFYKTPAGAAVGDSYIRPPDLSGRHLVGIAKKKC